MGLLSVGTLYAVVWFDRISMNWLDCSPHSTTKHFFFSLSSPFRLFFLSFSFSIPRPLKHMSFIRGSVYPSPHINHLIHFIINYFYFQLVENRRRWNVSKTKKNSDHCPNDSTLQVEWTKKIQCHRNFFFFKKKLILLLTQKRPPLMTAAIRRRRSEQLILKKSTCM